MLLVTFVENNTFCLEILRVALIPPQKSGQSTSKLNNLFRWTGINMMSYYFARFIFTPWDSILENILMIKCMFCFVLSISHFTPTTFTNSQSLWVVKQLATNVIITFKRYCLNVVYKFTSFSVNPMKKDWIEDFIDNGSWKKFHAILCLVPFVWILSNM